MNQQIESIKSVYRDKLGNFTERLDDLVQMSKINDLIKKQEKKEKNNKAIAIIVIIASVILAAGVAAAVYELFSRKRNKEYNLYDDLDNYYEDEKEVMSDPVGNLDYSEQDFAE